MKKIFILSMLVVTAFAVNAQSSGNKTTFAGGLRIALPTGNFQLSHSVGIGAELQAERKVTGNLSVTGTTGYTNFIGKTLKLGGLFTYKHDAVGYIPVLVGVRYYPSEKFFVGGKAGYGMLIIDNVSGAFNFEPQIGYNAPKYQVSLGYNALVDNGTLGHFGVTAVYKFN